VTEDLYSKRDRENLKIILSYCNNIEDAISSFGSDEEDFDDNVHFHRPAHSLSNRSENGLSDFLRS
jgi:hypothetical protein